MRHTQREVAKLCGEQIEAGLFPIRRDDFGVKRPAPGGAVLLDHQTIGASIAYFVR
jgi:hypothetical protein